MNASLFLFSESACIIGVPAHICIRIFPASWRMHALTMEIRMLIIFMNLLLDAVGPIRSCTQTTRVLLSLYFPVLRADLLLLHIPSGLPLYGCPGCPIVRLAPIWLPWLPHRPATKTLFGVNAPVLLLLRVFVSLARLDRYAPSRTKHTARLRTGWNPSNCLCWLPLDRKGGTSRTLNVIFTASSRSFSWSRCTGSISHI